VLALALLPALAAIAWVPDFVTQDGPAHLYNAHILRESLRSDSSYRDTYTVRWQPLPNWAGHLGLLGLMAADVPPRAADRLMMAGTLAGFAVSLMGLRRRVAGTEGSTGAALACAMLAMSLPWLFGFTSFLIGAYLFPLTLGVWWSGREHLSRRRIGAVAALLVLGYFAHLVSLGLTVIGLLVLAVAEPLPGRRRRLLRTLAALMPLVPLGVVYRRLMRGGGAVQPLWMELKDPFSLASWKAQLGWVDPLTLGSRFVAPFVEGAWDGFVVLVPVVWFGMGLGVVAAATVWRASLPLSLTLPRRGLATRQFSDQAEPAGSSPPPPGGRGPERSAAELAQKCWLVSLRGGGLGWGGITGRRGWLVLAAILLLGGLVGPDTLGASHGNYLAQRVLLLGLAALVPALEFGAARIGTILLAVAVALQSAFVWDYALRSDRLVGDVLCAGRHLGDTDRVGTLLLRLRQRYRANPLLHADNLLGVETHRVIWNNYETAHYYFPVQVRPDVPHPPPLAFEEISIRDAPAVAESRAEEWSALLEDHHRQIDALVIVGDDPTGRLDAITAHWFEPVAREGTVRIWRRRGRSAVATEVDAPADHP
jgi:hypothetical protein